MTIIGEPETHVNEGTPKPSSTNRSTKRAKIVESGLDLVGAFERGIKTLADAIKTAGNTLLDGLFEYVTLFQVLSFNTRLNTMLIW
jgi:hypothetical protein